MLQPIYADTGEVVDHYDDGQAAEVAQQEEPPAEQTWTVPDLLKGTSDLFIGMTVHHDDGHTQGPLVSLCVREVPDGPVTVKTFRAAELSEQAFLDNLQKAIAATMQVHFLAWAERQRKKLEEEAKRTARQSSTTKTTSTPAPATPLPPKASTAPKTPASSTSKAAPKPSKSAEKNTTKYATISMFD